MTENLEIAPRYIPVPAFNPNTMSVEAVRQSADQILGRDLIKDDDLKLLLGVPFLITRIIFYPGIGNGFATSELSIGDEAWLKKRRVDLTALPFEPEELLVFNDGSTGIRRQEVAYLWNQGRIQLPAPVIEEGKAGDSSFDLPPEQWVAISDDAETGLDNEGNLRVAFNVRLRCPRGLRDSNYKFLAEGSKKEQDATTFYLG